MKHLLTLLIIMATITVMGEIHTFTINTDEYIDNGKYNYYNDRQGTPQIPYSIIIENRVNIEHIDVEVSMGNGAIIPFEGYNEDISLEGGTAFKESPTEYYSDMQIGYSGNTTIISFVLFPSIYIDSDKYAYQYNVSVTYSVIDGNNIRSIYDMKYDLHDNMETLIPPISGPVQTASNDMLIITTDEYADMFNEFKQIQNMSGIITEIKTVEDIYREYSGTDKQEQIRNYIQEMYFGMGTRFIVIGGDPSIVPIRKAYNSNYYYYGFVPTDAYYADIDGDWNADGDTIIGELSYDGIDAYPDLYVGRIPFITADELADYLDKYYTYMFTMSEDNLDRFIVSGASITEGLYDGIGQKFSDYIKSMSNTYAYNFLSQYSPIEDTLNEYPRWQTGSEELNTANFINTINYGAYLINHVDHAHESWLGTGLYGSETEMFISDVNSINNSSNTMSIMFSMGCTSNPIDRGSIARELIVSGNSPIISYTGFSRTGWTSSQSMMNDFWNTLCDNETQYFYEAYASAMNVYYIYFRTAINNLGIPTLPVYHKRIKPMFASMPDTIYNGEGFTINVNDGTYSLNNATVVVMDSRNYFRDNTDLAGNIYVDKTFNDSMIYVGITSISARMIIDSIIVINDNYPDITEISIDPAEHMLTFSVCNNSNQTLRDITVSALINDTLCMINSDIQIESIPGFCNIPIEMPIDYYKSPLYECGKIIEFSIISENLNIDYNRYAALQTDAFSVSSFITNDSKRFKIESMNIVNENNAEIDADIIISSDYCTLSPDSFHVLFSSSDTVQLSNINISGVSDYDSLNFIITIKSNNREHTIDLKYNYTREINLQYSYSFNGVSLYHDCDYANAYVYRMDSGIFSKIADLEPGIMTFTDTHISESETSYYIIFTDNAGRTVDISDTVTINTYISVEKSPYQASGAYYGKLGDTRYYAKSSMNFGDMNNDGYEDIVIACDDGSITLLDRSMNPIYVNKSYSGRFHETTPALYDLDDNGILDIIVGYGTNGDTTAMILYNPALSDDSVSFITGYGVMKASPVVADIYSNNEPEIILGTSTGFYVFDSNNEQIDIFTRNYRNITAIASCTRDSAVVFCDYYGKVYALNRQGDMLPGFPYNTGEVILAPIITTDIDNNDISDIIIPTAMGHIFVIDIQGNIHDGFPYNSSVPIYQSPKISDYNNDCNLEISFLDLNGNLTVIDAYGNTISHYSTGDTEYNTYNEPVIVDIDNDNEQEIIICSRTGNIHIISFEGVLKKDILHIQEEITSTPLLIMDANSMALIIKTLNGNIYKGNFTEWQTRSVNNADMVKTLVDQQNTSNVDMRIVSHMKESTYNGEYVKKENSFILRDNIVSGTLNIDYSINMPMDINMSIIDKTGRVVYADKLNYTKHHYSLNLGDNDFPSGIYFVRADSPGYDTYTEKISYVK